MTVVGLVPSSVGGNRCREAMADVASALMVNVVAAVAFAGFVVGGLVLLRPRHAAAEDARGRRRVSAFILYVLGASFTAGLSQRDLWPFAHWPIVALIARPLLEIPEIRAVDAQGREHAVDYRALQPLALDDLAPWLYVHFPNLRPPLRERAASHLLGMIEDARQRGRRGERVGRFERVLGPFTAPYFLLHPKAWTSAEATPPEPFRRLRFYRLIWVKNEGITGRELDYEYPPP
jgi:hypothetical protein